MTSLSKPCKDLESLAIWFGFALPAAASASPAVLPTMGMAPFSVGYGQGSGHSLTSL